jgi:hypothetical protein
VKYRIFVRKEVWFLWMIKFGFIVWYVMD